MIGHCLLCGQEVQMYCLWCTQKFIVYLMDCEELDAMEFVPLNGLKESLRGSGTLVLVGIHFGLNYT